MGTPASERMRQYRQRQMRAGVRRVTFSATDKTQAALDALRGQDKTIDQAIGSALTLALRGDPSTLRQRISELEGELASTRGELERVKQERREWIAGMTGYPMPIKREAIKMLEGGKSQRETLAWVEQQCGKAPATNASKVFGSWRVELRRAEL